MILLVPLHEFNTCHEPSGSPAGGQFCTTAGPTWEAHLVKPNASYDINRVVAEGGTTRVFLFNPSTGFLAMGGGGDFAEKSHAEAANNIWIHDAEGQKVRRIRYDNYILHGYVVPRNGKLAEVRISRIIVDPYDDYSDSAGTRAQQVGVLEEMARRLKAVGAGPDVGLQVYGWGGMGLRGNTLGTAFPELYPKKRQVREFNTCHAPAGSPAGGQFCSTQGQGYLPALKHYPRPHSSEDLPDYLKDEVLMARRAGIAVHHRRQPEPLMDIAGNIVDPLAYSHAQRGREVFYDKKGFGHVAPRGRVVITTRGGEFEPLRQVWSSEGYPRGHEKKDLTPEMLPDDLKATVEDVESTFRHEVGHIMDPSHAGGKVGAELAREIRAWQYAVAISPDHRISAAMVQRGLYSHAYGVFRKRGLLAEESYLQRVASWDLDERLDRILSNELRTGAINIAAHRQATAFTARVQKALDHYAAVLRKKGIVRVPQPADPYFPGRGKYDTPLMPGPGGRGWL